MTFVSTVAASVPALSELDATWTVIGSTSSIDATDNIGSSDSGVGIYRLDGSLVVDGTTGFFTVSFIDNFFTETGAPISGAGIWLGTWMWGSGVGGTGIYDHELGTSLPRATGGYANDHLLILKNQIRHVIQDAVQKGREGTSS